MKCKIAVVQFKIKQFGVTENLQKAEKFIAKASNSGADIIVFPEDFVTGSIEGTGKLIDYNHTHRKHFQVLAKKYKINIVPGSIIEGGKTGVYNTAYYIDSNGKVIGKYRKVHLWISEQADYTPGNKAVVFKTKFGKIGLIICWDLAFPEIFRAMVKREVEIVICPSYWCYGDAGQGIKYDANSEAKQIDALCVARAFENEIILVHCNAAGAYQSVNYSDPSVGHSQITTPFKGVVKKLAHHKEVMFIQEIDTAILSVAEKSYQIRKNLKSKLVL